MWRVAGLALCTLGSMAALVSMACADPVVLVSKDGYTSFEGDLVSLEGDFYIIKTSVGQVRVPVSEVICEGAGCPAGGAGAGNPNMETLALAQNVPFEVATLIAHAQGAAASAEVSYTERDAKDVIITMARAGNPPATQFRLLGLKGSEAAPKQATAMIGTSGAYGSFDGARRVRDVVALDAFVVVLSPDVPLRSISLTDLARIYAGEITNWSQLRGPNLAIQPFVREAGSIERAALETLVMTPAGKAFGRGVVSFDSDAGIAKAARSIRGAIGITKYRTRQSARVIGLAGPCGEVAVPDAFSIRAGDYPLVEMMHTSQGSPRAARGILDILDFAASPAGGTALSNNGFLVPAVVAQDTKSRAILFNRMVAESAAQPKGSVARASLVTLVRKLLPAFRLSTTIRQGQPGGPIAAWSRGELNRLAGYLRTGALDGHEIMFVGFEGSAGNAADAVTRSSALADQALATFLEKASDLVLRKRLSFSAQGFGGVVPITCVRTPIGRLVNTRIEVWARPTDPNQ